ncbi:MAG TPA: hypothetical protein VLO12_01375 [Halomonas sp.]|nr:hypothetical protein [Halomonas sp.]
MHKAVLVMLMAMMVSMPVLAQSAGQHIKAQPHSAAMVADAVIARPLLAAATLGGTAIFLVSLPFTALGGNVGSSAEALIKSPAEAAFRRCLGCTVSKRADEL